MLLVQECQRPGESVGTFLKTPLLHKVQELQRSLVGATVDKDQGVLGVLTSRCTLLCLLHCFTDIPGSAKRMRVMTRGVTFHIFPLTVKHSMLLTDCRLTESSVHCVDQVPICLSLMGEKASAGDGSEAFCLRACLHATGSIAALAHSPRAAAASPSAPSRWAGLPAQISRLGATPQAGPYPLSDAWPELPSSYSSLLLAAAPSRVGWHTSGHFKAGKHSRSVSTLAV